jgi:mannose-6-phosphate isomerase-like protein (cupin superfamily)
MTASPRKINLADKFALIDEAWSPRVAGDINDFQVKLVKLRGSFAWHRHEVEDELFLVIQGRLRMRFRDRDEIVGQGELIIVPHGIEHCPVAETDEVQVVLLEPATTLNTGDADDPRRRPELARI